jgi:hypothetical protein
VSESSRGPFFSEESFKRMCVGDSYPIMLANVEMCGAKLYPSARTEKTRAPQAFPVSESSPFLCMDYLPFF